MDRGGRRGSGRIIGLSVGMDKSMGKVRVG
mgnify:CR=1 FL=1